MKQWYGVRTFPGYEHKVEEKLKKLIEKDGLENSIEDIYIPAYKNYTFVRRVLKRKEELVYPGYVFIKMNLTNEIMYSVRGVQYILGYAGTNEMKKKPDVITEAEMQKMMQDGEKRTSTLEIGDKVIAVVGLNEYEVEILELDLIRETLKAEINNQVEEFKFENILKVK